MDVPPGAGAGIVYTEYINSAGWYQEYLDLTTGIKWWRHKRASTLTAWTSDIYRRSNILATVGQSGGVPTGGIIERGANASGEYVRFADGTQICIGRADNIGPISSVVGSGFSSLGETPLGTYPASFSGPPVVGLISGNTGGSLYSIATAVGSGTSTQPPGAQLFRFTSQGSTLFFVRYLAVGWWF
jgi:hypothetical protein